LGISKKFDKGNFEEEGVGEEEEEDEGGESEKMNAEKVVEMRERDKGLLVVEDDAEQVGSMALHG